jgi:hypothetical protein
MMEIVTWLSVLVLGPGSIAIFIWFLFSLREILRERNRGRDR